MSRLHYMCSKCKFDKTDMCDYECIKAKLHLYICPRFVYNDGTPITNADMIRSMSDEELAELMDGAGDYFNCEICEFREPDKCGEGCIGRGCKNYILAWLKMEIE